MDEWMDEWKEGWLMSLLPRGFSGSLVFQLVKDSMKSGSPMSFLFYFCIFASVYDVIKYF